MSSSLLATGRKTNEADCSGGMFASCIAGLIVNWYDRAMDGRTMHCSNVSLCQSAVISKRVQYF